MLLSMVFLFVCFVSLDNQLVVDMPYTMGGGHTKVKEVYYTHGSDKREAWHATQGPYERSSRGTG